MEIPSSFLKVVLPTVLTFIIGIGLTPWLTGLFYKYKLWKRASRHDGETNPTITEEFKKIHNADAELSTPRVGGIVIWVSVLATTTILWLLAHLSPSPLTEKLDFVSKSQTFLPLVAFMVGAIIGLLEDFLEISPWVNRKWTHGLPSRYIISFVVLFGLIFGLWFYHKLGVSEIAIPFFGYLDLGWLFIPFFILVSLGTFSSRIIDGIDGLAGGVMAIIFAAYAVIAFSQNQIDIAAFSSVVSGGILVFLWFNIPPARFWMGETGMLALTLALVVVAFLTDAAVLLLVIGFPLVATSLSSTLQIWSKKLRGGKRLFRIAPLHNYFLAIGWSREKVTMRYWVVSLMCAVAGILISIIT